MKLSQPYYIEPRSTNAHIDMNGMWDFCWLDKECEDFESLKFDYTSKIPWSVYYSIGRRDITASLLWDKQ